ncbi:MAG TPA: SDR family NAD(P)-dependent oxidoreductase [Ramlibacter sp.]|jgi:3-oxoacyl-[acyl-carrier protein] reductase|nr:SDR family NAD(P)-dependent oxidoreductase [Ramlibacter sp.]
MNNSSRSALVTGAAGGIGLATARLLASRGVRVLLADRSDTVIDAARSLREQGADAGHFVVDLEQEQGVLALAAHAKDAFGGCDILVNNAGINPKLEGGGYPLERIDLALWNKVMAVNVTAPFLLSRELLPGMRQQGWGRVINVASRAGRAYIPGVSVFYSAGKSALIGMTRQLAGDHAQHGITLNCVAPGPVQTPLALQSTAEVRAKVTAAIPARRSGTAEEVAAAIDFLASDAAGYVCGACIDVNGGGFMA